MQQNTENVLDIFTGRNKFDPYDQEDLEEMDKMYRSMSKYEIRAHFESISKILWSKI